MDLAAPAQVFGLPGARALPAHAVRPGGRCGRDHGRLRHGRRAGLEALRAADTVIVPGFAPTAACPPRRCSARLRRLMRAAPASSRSARARSRWPQRACWTDAARRRTGCTRPSSRAAGRASPSTRRALRPRRRRAHLSAGVASGIDLCLHIVRCDFGAAVGNAIARRIVVAPHRAGGPGAVRRGAAAGRSRAAGSLEPTRAWLLERLGEPVTVREMARHANVSERTFARRFRPRPAPRRCAGCMPSASLARPRVARAHAAVRRRDRAAQRVRQRDVASHPPRPRTRHDSERLPWRVRRRLSSPAAELG